MSINTNNLIGYECESWPYRAVFVFLQQWLEKILTYIIKSKNSDNVVSTPFFEIKKIGRTKYANYRHVRSTMGILGILSFNAKYLLASPSRAHSAGYVITLAHTLARCLAMRKKTPNSKGKILVSKKEVDAELLEIGLKHSTKDGYQFCLNSWLRNELEKDYGKNFPIEFVEFEEKPVKQNLGEQVTIENTALNEQTQGLIAIGTNEQASEQISILKQTVIDLEQEQKDKEDEIAMYKRLADERYATMIKMQAAFEQEKAKIRAEIAALNTTKVETAPTPVVESKVEIASAPVEKQSFLDKIKSCFTSNCTVDPARLALKWLRENEASIQKKDKKFVYDDEYLAKKIGLSSRFLKSIDTNPSLRIDVRSRTMILNFAKKMGYVEPQEQRTNNVQSPPTPVSDLKTTTVIESTLATQDVDDDNEKEPTEQERETLALNEVYDTIQSLVATGPKDRYELSKQVKQQSFVFFKDSKYSLDTMITRLVDSHQLQYVGDKICAMSH